MKTSCKEIHEKILKLEKQVNEFEQMYADKENVGLDKLIEKKKDIGSLIGEIEHDLEPNYNNFKCLKERTDIEGRINSIAATDDKRLIIAVDLPNGEQLRVWDWGAEILDTLTSEILDKLKGPEYGHINKIITTKDNKLVTANYDGTVQVWDIDTRECLQTMFSDMEKGSNNLKTVIELKNGNLASAGNIGKIQIWNPQTGECVAKSKEKDVGQIDVLVETQNGELITAHPEGKIRVWGNDITKPPRVFQIKDISVKSVDSMVELKNNLIACAYGHQGIYIFNYVSGKSLGNIPTLVSDMYTTKSGKLATVKEIGIQVWDTESEKCLATLPFNDEIELKHSKIIETRNNQLVCAGVNVPKNTLIASGSVIQVWGEESED